MILWFGGAAYTVSGWAWAAVAAMLAAGAQWGDGGGECVNDGQTCYE